MFELPSPRYDELPRYKDALAKVDKSVRVAALDAFLEGFNAIYSHLRSDTPPDYEARIPGPGDAVLDRLQTDGFALLQADQARKTRLAELVDPTAAALEAQLGAIQKPKLRDGQAFLDRTRDADIYAAVEAILAAAGLPAVASAYAGREVVLRDVLVQVNTPRAARSMYGFVNDAGIPRIPTTYFHIDSALWPHQKVLIYLHPMTLDQGPFRYVRGSHRTADPFELAVRKANDRLNMPMEQFLALPEPFRANAKFGGDLDPDSLEAQSLLAREVAVFDKTGSDLILFDYHGVHRGGFVRTGVRRILQCTLMAKG